jgi:hypothetical protein
MPIQYSGKLEGQVSRLDLGAYTNKLEARRVGSGDASQYTPMPGNPDATVLPRSDRMGGSSAWNPRKPPHKKLVINGGVDGGTPLVLDLSFVTPELANKAAAYARTIVQGDVMEAGRDTQQDFAEAYMWYLRESGAATETRSNMQQLEATIGTAPGITNFADSEPQPPPMPTRPHLEPVAIQPQAPAPIPQPAAPPIQQFAQGAAQAPVFKQAAFAPTAPATPPRNLLDAFRPDNRPIPTMRPDPVVTSNSVEDPVAPPMIRVRFDIPGPSAGRNLEFQTDFHEWHLAVGGNAILFVYDQRYRGGERLMFSQGVDGHFACYIDGTSVVYLIESPNIEFRIGNKAYYMYSVIESKSTRESYGS